MKAVYALIYTMLLSLTHSLSPTICNGEGIVSSKSECYNLPFHSKYSYCCFCHVKYTTNGESVELKTCSPLTKEAYDKIDEYIKSLEKNNVNNKKIEILSLDCNSYYLHTTIFALLLFILI